MAAMTNTYQEAMRELHRPAHARRTAQSQAAFLLPHLRPGMALLDLGCGPCTITVGLAEAVAPGQEPSSGWLTPIGALSSGTPQTRF